MLLQVQLLFASTAKNKRITAFQADNVLMGSAQRQERVVDIVLHAGLARGNFTDVMQGGLRIDAAHDGAADQTVIDHRICMLQQV